MGSEYSKVSRRLWSNKRYRELPNDEARYLYLYFLTNEHQTSAGAYRIHEGYALTDLQWTDEKYRSIREILVEADLIVFDAETDEVFIRRWFQHAPATNQRHAKGIETIICFLDSDIIREKAESEFEFSRIEPPPDPHKPGPDGHLTETGYIQGRGRG